MLTRRVRQWANQLALRVLEQGADAEGVTMSQNGGDPVIELNRHGGDPVIELDRHGIDLLMSWAKPCTQFRVTVQQDGIIVLNPMSVQEAELLRCGILDEIVDNFAHPERMIRLKADKL
jgi:hypothetical protein